MTIEIASSEHVKWQCVHGTGSINYFMIRALFTGRLDAKTQEMIEQMFWLYVSRMSRFERAGLDHIWSIHGSENHEMMHYSNALLALQALKNSPKYKGVNCPTDGTLKLITGHGIHTTRNTVSRAKHGLLVEVFSAYGPSYTCLKL